MSSSNMNAAVHTSSRVHRCRDDVLGTSAIHLNTPHPASVFPLEKEKPLARTDQDKHGHRGHLP
jgi:hypothetical protein